MERFQFTEGNTYQFRLSTLRLLNSEIIVNVDKKSEYAVQCFPSHSSVDQLSVQSQDGGSARDLLLSF